MMTELIRLPNIQFEALFKTNKLTIQQGDIIGIIGANGSGKTTLMHLLNRKIAPSIGKISFQLNEDQIYFMEQELHEFTAKTNDFTTLPAWKTDAAFASLSGGEKIKKRLQFAFAQNSPLLLLDEPTNHLDEQSVDELIALIKQKKQTVVIVSHNRYFLNAVVSKIWAIENGEINEYIGDYDHYMSEVAIKKQTQQNLYEEQQKEKRKVQLEMQKLKDWSKTSYDQSTKQEGMKEYYRKSGQRMDKKRKSIEKRLQMKLDAEGVTKVADDPSIYFHLHADQVKSGTAFEFLSLSKSFGKKNFFTNLHVTIPFGEKLAISGVNGSGKSTLLKCLLGEIPYEGDIWASEFANIGYLSQSVFDLPLEQTIEEYFDIDLDERGSLITSMIQLGFAIEHYTMPIAQLSMGERIKLKLLKEMMDQKNVLILDEPTNHLDIPSREQLEDVLLHYNGTIIFVSHDRYFREKIASKTLILQNGQLVNAEKQRQITASVEEKMLLNLRKDKLLSELSFATFGSDQYVALDKEFNEVLQRLRKLNE